MTLNELLAERTRGDAGSRVRLVEVAAAAKAWVETYVECEAVEWFRFEIDPAPTGS